MMSGLVDRLRLRDLVRALGALSVGSAGLLVALARVEGVSWVSVAALALVNLAATEWVCTIILKRRYAIPAGHEPRDFRMEPHVFAHFLPSTRYRDMSAEGFRVTAPPEPGAGARGTAARQPVIYLAGDCTVFEHHLPPEETMAWQLREALDETMVLNAGAPHYTALHAYHRFVIDLVRGARPDRVVFFSAANDCLTFVHHKHGVVSPDHTHLYQPWISSAGLHRRISRCPTSALKVLLCVLWYGRRGVAWDRWAEEVSPEFRNAEHVRIARSLFDPSTFVTCLTLFHSACQAIGAELVLTTYAYHRDDMREEPRRTYAWGIDRFNQEIRTFAQRQGVALIDLAEALRLEEGDIYNKWHFTKSGNRKRAAIVAQHLRAARSPRWSQADAVLRLASEADAEEKQDKERRPSCM